jgi:hypothetical protein
LLLRIAAEVLKKRKGRIGGSGREEQHSFVVGNVLRTSRIGALCRSSQYPLPRLFEQQEDRRENEEKCPLP